MRKDSVAKALRDAAERKGVLGKCVKGIGQKERIEQHRALMRKLPKANMRKPLWMMGLGEE